VLAALGPRMLELAAERSGGALTYHAAPEATAWARSILGSGPLLAVEQAVLMEQDPAEARRVGREYVAFYLTSATTCGPGAGRVRAGGARQRGQRPTGGRDGGLGRPRAIAERAQADLDAGADHVCLNVLDADPNALPIGSWRVLAPALLGR